MQNLFEIVRDSLHFNKFELDNVLCVEYTCPLEDEWMGVASQTDYIVLCIEREENMEVNRWRVGYGSGPNLVCQERCHNNKPVF